MNSNTIFIEDKELELLQNQLNQQQIKSDFDFLNEHKGLKKGQVHLILGPDTNELSILSRSIILDSARTKKVLILLSDKTIEQYSFELNRICRNKETLENIILISEIEIGINEKKNCENYIHNLEMEINNLKPDLFIIDNLSTSLMCSSLIGLYKQHFVASSIKKIAINIDIPILCFGHTTKKERKKNTQFTDIVGTNDSDIFIHFASYIYILRLFNHDNRILPVISIQKSRYHEIKNNYFKLFYDENNKIYTKSVAIDTNIVESLFHL